MSAAPECFPNVVIRASAGTGKTFQLSNRFISLAAAGEPPDAILATTFTRKAAGEILNQVLMRLARAALDAEKLAELARHAGDGRLDAPRCLDMLQNMLRQLHRIRVGTLDSFFIQIARSFSLELGLPPGWQIVDEVIDARLRAEAVGEVLRDESTRDTVRLMNLLGKGEASRSVSRQITGLVNELYDVYLESPAGAWDSLPRGKPLEPDELKAALDTLAEVGLPEHKGFVKARDQALDNARAGDWAGFISAGLAPKIIDGQTLFRRKPIEPHVVDAYEPLIRHAKAVLLGVIADQTKATRVLLGRFDEAYWRLKISRRALRFEDVTRKLADTWLGKRLDQVVYRLDAHTAHLLLDEFQDTSPLQWRVLRPFAQRVVDRGGGRSFFCVGDVKQAIFGWRGGVAEIFEAIRDELDNLQPESLDESYRSAQPVIDTVNRVFEDIAANTVTARCPAAADNWSRRFTEHTTACKRLRGYCRLITAPRAEEGENQGEKTLDYAADRIAEVHRQAPGRSVGVLVRKNRTVARLIYELRSREIRASEEGGNPLGDSPAVVLVLSLLALADHPGDTTARFHVARSPLAEELGMTDHEDSAAAWQVSQRIREALMTDGYGPTLYGWAKMLATHCDRRDLNRLSQLVELAYAYEAEATGRTDDFADLVRRRKVEDPAAADVRVMTFHKAKGLQFDIVVLPELDSRLSGQHPQLIVGRAGPTKPIERVCRYVSEKNRPLLPRPFRQMFEDRKRLEIEESLCVLYVALTRAVHSLHMIIAPSANNERNLPTTSAGVVRAALTDARKAEPETTLYAHGDPDWFGVSLRKRPAAPVEPEPAADRPPVLRLAQNPGRPSRGLERRSPSQLEGGPRVELAGRLRLEGAESLSRGTLMHAWFELIEWLEDLEEGLPDDDQLRQVAASVGAAGLDVDRLIRQFRAALDKPAVRSVLSRNTYQQPAGEDMSAVHAGPEVANPKWQVWRERPFAVRLDDTILSGTVDRLVVLYDGRKAIGADVIDFKTDAIAADDAAALEARTETYRPQLEAYRHAVAALLRLDPSRISARLVFIEPDVVRGV